MAVRGAPAIGVAAAFGIALGARRVGRRRETALRAEFDGVCEQMRVTRPDRGQPLLGHRADAPALRGGRRRGAVRPCAKACCAEALAILDEDLAACHRMGDLGAELIPRPSRVLTHCNAGALATAGYGTALGVIRSAARDGNVLGRVRGRDAAVPAGRAPHRLGARRRTASPPP